MTFVLEKPAAFAKAEGLKRVNINGKRHYMVDGIPLASVTTILGHKPKPALDEWRARVGEEEAARITQQSAYRGTGMHSIAEQYLLNQEIDVRKCMPNHLDMFEWIKPQFKRIGKLYGVEQQLYSKTLAAAGTADVLGEFDGIDSVIDFKTSRKPKREEWVHDYFKQEAIYSFMAYELAGLHLRQIVTIIAVESTEDCQVFVQRARPWLDAAIVDIIDYQKAQIAS